MDSKASRQAVIKAFRGQVLHFVDDPARVGEADSHLYFEDGLLVTANGLVRELGPAGEMLPRLEPGTPVEDLTGRLIMPGFVDCHVHYSQLEMVASYGRQLLDWLDGYAFPTEAAFSDADHARAVAEAFLDELLRNGTTTALVMATVHRQSVESFFQAALTREMRLICGKVLSDRNVPDYLADTPEQGFEDSAGLIADWHGRERLSYALTPRFAPSCSDDQLALTGRLLTDNPGVYLHTHLAENSDEVAWVADLFPDRTDYLDVYAHHGLLGRRSVLAHGIHLDESGFTRLADSGAAIAHCPTSNLFLGSGLFDLAGAAATGTRVGLGTDVGAGTSLSLLTTMAEAYKVQQLRGRSLSPFRAFYLATLGGARALDLEGVIGSFQPGAEADFIVLDPTATPLLARRMETCADLAERLFALAVLGDDRAVAATYIRGVRAHSRDE